MANPQFKEMIELCNALHVSRRPWRPLRFWILHTYLSSLSNVSRYRMISSNINWFNGRIEEFHWPVPFNLNYLNQASHVDWFFPGAAMNRQPVEYFTVLWNVAWRPSIDTVMCCCSKRGEVSWMMYCRADGRSIVWKSRPANSFVGRQTRTRPGHATLDWDAVSEVLTATELGLSYRADPEHRGIDPLLFWIFSEYYVFKVLYPTKGFEFFLHSGIGVAAGWWGNQRWT